MSFVNRIVAELREKRLWPVAGALLIALIAVPLLLSGGSKSTPVAQVPQSGVSAPAVGALPAVGVSSSATSSRLTGSSRDPFAQQASAKPATAGLATFGTRAGETAGSASTTTATSSESSRPTAPTPASSSGTPGPSIPTFFVFVADLIFGTAGSQLHTYRDVARLSPFPSAKQPLVVFLGIRNDGKTAVFLLSSLAAATGQGRCLPSASECDFLDLKPGQRERLLVVNPNGTLSKYTVAVSAVESKPVTSVTKALIAHARMSALGRQIVARAARVWAPLWSWSYSFGTGLLSYNAAQHALLVPGRPLAQSSSGVVLQPAGSR